MQAKKLQPELPIKHYASLREISSDVHTIRRNFLATRSPSLRQRVNSSFFSQAATVTRVRGGRDVTQTRVANRTPVADKLRTSAINKSTDKRDTLRKQDEVLTNILLNLSTQFANENNTTVSKLKALATQLQKTIRSQLQEEDNAAHERTQERLSNNVVQFIKLTRTTLEKRLGVKGELKFTDALVNKTYHQIAYLQFRNIKSVGTTKTPLVVITFTTSPDTSYVYVNPSTFQVHAPGEYAVGEPIDVTDPSKGRDAAVRLISTQLAADAHLAALDKKPIPFEPHKNLFAPLKDVIKTDFKADEGQITLTLAPSIATAEAAQEAANDARVHIENAMLAANPGRHDRIVYKTAKVGRNWKVVFQFTSGDRKGGGRTFNQSEIEHLRQIFPDHEISIMRKALNESR